MATTKRDDGTPASEATDEAEAATTDATVVAPPPISDAPSATGVVVGSADDLAEVVHRER